jgi:hypothetical protein
MFADVLEKCSASIFSLAWKTVACIQQQSIGTGALSEPTGVRRMVKEYKAFTSIYQAIFIHFIYVQ